ncbi:unnamed protein product [Prunus armeniaca]
MVLAQFEELTMSETETILEFYEKVEQITNKAMSLGHPIEELLIVQKILRDLPPRFQNLNQIRLSKLVGKLKTYEMELNMEENDAKKKECFTSGSARVFTKRLKKSSPIDDEMTLFMKKFRRILKDKGRETRRNGGHLMRLDTSLKERSQMRESMRKSPILGSQEDPKNCINSL